MGASEEKEKNKEGQFPADATLAACKILLQPSDTGTHSLVGWTWKDWDHSPIHPFLSSIHYAWFCSILGGRVYDLSGCMLAITPAELFTLHQNNSKQTSFQWAGQTSRTVCVSFKILRPQACNYQGPKVSKIWGKYLRTEPWHYIKGGMKKLLSSPLSHCWWLCGRALPAVWNTGLIASQNYVFNLLCAKAELHLSFKTQ